MARSKRIVVPGLPHHVTQRGVRRCDTFLDAQDRKVYESLLLKSCKNYSLDVFAYSWMTNHVHVIAVPKFEYSLSCVFRDTNGLYAVYFNRKYDFSGHLWQARFYSCTLDEERLWSAVRYVERNPVRAGMVLRAEEYDWSSAASHCFNRENPLLTPLEPQIQLIPDWSLWLADEDAPEVLAAIRRNTASGRPLGSETFLRQLEVRLGRSLAPRRRGRKPKNLVLAVPNVK
jgi:putative transposase